MQKIKITIGDRVYPLSVTEGQEDITNCKSYDELPCQLIEYVSFIENFLETPVGLVSVGPDRKQTIFR